MKSLSTNTFVPGETYSFSAIFANLGSSGTTEYKLTLQYDLNGETNYAKIAQTTGKNGGFTQLSNPSYTIPSGATNLVLVAETTEDTNDFFIDEIIAAPAGATAEQSTYMFHDTFESGTNSWSARGGATVASNSDTAYKGSKALSITGRSASWNGAMKSLSTSTFVPGKSYAFSACFTNLSGSDPTEFKLTLQYDLNDETKYDKIAQTSGNRGEFVQLYNSKYTIPSGATNLVLVAETTEETCDFYIDEVIAAPAGTKIDGPKSTVISTKNGNKMHTG